MTYDFRANQVRLNRIISSGSIPIIIYASSSATDLQGGKNFPDPGSDVFLFVSGSSTAKTLFGGDVVVSGSLANGFAVAFGYASHAEGFGNYAGGDYSHTEGQGNATQAQASHAEGNGTIANATFSHTEGWNTITYGVGSHAEGYGSEAYGTGSLAAGLYTVASGAIDGVDPPTTTQATFGKYNLQYNTVSLFVVGDGLNDSNRHDILRVNSGSVEVTGSFKVSGGITGSISGTVSGLPFIAAGPNINTNYNSLGQWEITGSGGSNLWTEVTPTFIYTTSSIGIKTTVDHPDVDLFISGSDTTGNGANLVLYNDLSGFGLPRLTLSSSSGSLGGLVGYDDDVNGLVDGINIDIPSTRNFGFRIGGGTAATTVDSAGNLNVRYGSQSTAYFDVTSRMVGIGVTPSLLTSYTNASRLVLRDTNNLGIYQLFISNEDSGPNLNSGIAFAFGAASISGAIYAKSNTTGADRKGLNALIPTGNSFSWRTTGAHLGELTDSGSLIISGSVKAYTGFTGSLSGTIGGLPFIIGGPNITASYNNLGQWAITGSGGGGSTVPGGLDTQVQFNSGSTFSGSSNLTYNYTTNTLTLTGSLTASTVVAGGVNITPVTASLFVYGDGINRGSGSISGLFGLGSLMTAGTIGKFDVEILAMSYGSQTGASWKYTTTALWPSSGNFSFLATTELAAEYGPTSGSYNPAAEWDVNFNSLGDIELTGSAPALALPGGTSFYVQVTKKMVATYGTILA